MSSQPISHPDVLQPSTGPLWLQAISLPTLNWVRPFLTRMGFPATLIPNLDTLKAISEATEKKRLSLWNDQKNLEYSSERDARITHDFVVEVLDQLAATAGQATADAFKKWAMRNFIDESAHGALLVWRIILSRAAGFGNQFYQLVELPIALKKHLPAVANLIIFDARQTLHDELIEASPPYKDEMGVGNDLSPEAMIIEEIAADTQTRAALRALSETLTAEECIQVAEWAKKQAIQQKAKPEMLQIERFWPYRGD